jgi:hypothetical protein
MADSDESVATTIKITKITYGRTVNIGNFENVRFDFTAEVPPEEDYRRVLGELKRLADREEARIRREYE